MARDYAKKPQGSKTRRSSDKRKAKRGSNKQAGNNALRIYFAGVLSGVFLCFIVYLAMLDTPDQKPTPRPAAPQAATAEESTPKPRFDFYKLLPEQRIEVEVEPAPAVKDPTPDTRDVYVLQAGSFRQLEDADRRRAELLLISLSPTIEETTGDNGRWYRVYLGPFESRSEMARARSLTANQDIDTLLLKRELPLQ